MLHKEPPKPVPLPLLPAGICAVGAPDPAQGRIHLKVAGLGSTCCSLPVQPTWVLMQREDTAGRQICRGCLRALEAFCV